MAAAFEGIVLGIPAIAISQQSGAREMGFMPGRRLRLHGRGRGSAPSWFGCSSADPLPAGDPAERQLPGRRAAGDRGHPARQAALQRRAAAGRRGRRRAGAATRSTASSPPSRTSRAPTCRRSRAGRISITPVHFDLTDREGLDRLAGVGPGRGCFRGRARRAPPRGT